MFGVGVKGAALEPQEKGVPVDAESDPQGKEGKAGKGPSQVARGDGPAPKVEMGGEENLVFFLQDHVHLGRFVRALETPVVGDLHSDEGGGVEFLAELVPGPFDLARILPGKGLGVALAPRGVGDFRHEGMGPGLFLIPRVVESHRIEAMPEGSQVSEDGDRALDGLADLFGHGRADRFLEEEAPGW